MKTVTAIRHTEINKELVHFIERYEAELDPLTVDAIALGVVFARIGLHIPAHQRMDIIDRAISLVGWQRVN